jgi:hypothetical protein
MATAAPFRIVSCISRANTMRLHELIPSIDDKSIAGFAMLQIEDPRFHIYRSFEYPRARCASYLETRISKSWEDLNSIDARIRQECPGLHKSFVSAGGLGMARDKVTEELLKCIGDYGEILLESCLETS